MDQIKIAHSQISRSEVFQVLARLSIASVITFYSIKWMFKHLDPTNKDKRSAKARAEKIIKRINNESGLKISPQQFNEYELVIASSLIVPSDIAESWRDIAGLDDAIQELTNTLIYPIRFSKIFENSKLWQPPKGVLLFGPPGCGKTLIAKATAKEAGMRFINVDVAMLTDKWYGETQKLAKAVFSLAVKIQPCIIFIDEIDSFLRSRHSSDHEATAMLKTQFMMLWDGLVTNSKSSVFVMGATNRPQFLDKAILRRMPTQLHIGLPSEKQRLLILKLVLDGEKVADGVNLEKLATLAEGFSGSDLRELCRRASVQRIQSFSLTHDARNFEKGVKEFIEKEPAITMDDLMSAMKKMLESRSATSRLPTGQKIQLI